MVFQKASELANTNADKKELKQREAREAMADYEAEGAAGRKKTARLRALRLARDAAGAVVTKPV